MHASHEPQRERGAERIALVASQHVEAGPVLLDVGRGGEEETLVDRGAADAALRALEAKECGEVTRRRSRDLAAPAQKPAQKMA